MVHPKATKIVYDPSIVHEKFSPKRIGDINALKIIVIHDVDEIKIIFPKLRAIPLSVCAIPKRSKPKYQSIYK